MENLPNCSKIDIVVLPNFEDKTWRTRGLVIFNEFDVIYDESLDVFAHKHTVMRTIAHSIISQGGYGYIFDISCLSYWWLNEGFVMFLETYILDKAFPDSRMMDLFVVQNQYESRYLTSKDTANCMEYTGDIFKINPVISFSPIKGAVIWRMLEYLAHDVFWKSLHTYVNQTSFNFKTPDDLWYTMEAAARRHKDTFKDLSNLWKFQEIVLNISSIFDPLGEHMYGPTVPTNNDFDKCLVQERSKWACFFDHPLCIKAAENQLKLYLNNSEKNTFLPDWRKWILCNGLKTANNSLWDHVSKVLKKAVSMKRENAAVFELLSCFKDHLIIQNYLSVTQTLLYENIIMKDIPIDEKMIKENNKMYALITNMYLSALSRHAKTTKGLEELLKNFEKMRPIHISTNAAMTVIINSALSSRQISTIHKFATRILSPNLIYQISPTFIIRNQKISHHMEFIRNLYEKLSIN
ncbi:uncharacterized protein LOC114934079 isoform X4 [Nylanderia fulva]|uniref:uncharacterized protein LOC114934079 isoform X4 n=1 Tax=Nylanderia fulva TaxID=613905 RepID=UPI0010FB7090|nr:uncharacterized protein LOC114934079 isoform X4 [Nylanderia fulva]